MRTHKQRSSAGISAHRGSQIASRVLDPARRSELPISPALRIQQANELKSRISQWLEGELSLTITDNRTVMLSVRRDIQHRRYTVRLHHLFVDASTSILQALATYIRTNSRASSAQLNAFIDSNDHRIADPSQQPQRATVIRTAGKVYDLRQLFDELNAKYFGGRVTSRITWGRNAGRGRRRSSIRLGSYTLEEDLIRVHPGLDQHWIPRHYIAWVIYHEMLHVIHPIPKVNGRRRFHTPRFAQDERLFEHFEQTHRWERSNIATLLCI